MRGTLLGICGALVLGAGCSPAEKAEAPAHATPPAEKVEARREYTASVAVAGDYSGPTDLVMQDWKFSHLRLQSPQDQYPVAFVFQQTKPVVNAHGERQKLIVVATEYIVTGKDITVSAVSSSGGALAFDGRFEGGQLVGTLTIGSNPPVVGALTKTQ